MGVGWLVPLDCLLSGCLGSALAERQLISSVTALHALAQRRSKLMKVTGTPMSASHKISQANLTAAPAVFLWHPIWWGLAAWC